MTLSEMLPTIQSLPRADKLRLIQLLAADVARDDGITLDMADKTVPIWSRTIPSKALPPCCACSTKIRSHLDV